jgi:hypothetical protein
MAAADPVWSGTIAYRAVIPAARLHGRAPGHRVFKQPTQASRLLRLGVFTIQALMHDVS